MSQASVYLCPCCDKPLEPDTKVCPQCNQPVSVSSASLADMALPLVNKYLQGYNKALAADPSNQEAAGYAAMCFLKLRLSKFVCRPTQ